MSLCGPARSPFAGDDNLTPNSYQVSVRLLQLAGIRGADQIGSRLCRSALLCLFSQVTLADQQADPNSPLFSVKSFEDLGLCVPDYIPPNRKLNADVSVGLVRAVTLTCSRASTP